MFDFIWLINWFINSFVFLFVFFCGWSNKGKSHRTVTFSKSDTKEKVKFGAAGAGAGAAADEDSPSHQAHLGTSGRKYPGGSNRQQNVKMEFQMNKVCFIIFF